MYMDVKGSVNTYLKANGWRNCGKFSNTSTIIGNEKALNQTGKYNLQRRTPNK
jgi:hypothetical protein